MRPVSAAICSTDWSSRYLATRTWRCDAGKAPQRAHDLVVPFELVGVSPDGHRDQAGVDDGTAPLGLVVAGQAAAGNGTQPGGEGGVAPERRGRADRLQVGLLHQVGRRLLVAPHAGVDEAVDHRSRDIQERPDGGRVARLDLAQQRGVSGVSLGNHRHGVGGPRGPGSIGPPGGR